MESFFRAPALTHRNIHGFEQPRWLRTEIPPYNVKWYTCYTCINRWVGARETWLQCVSDGVISLPHQPIEIYMVSNRFGVQISSLDELKTKQNSLDELCYNGFAINQIYIHENSRSWRVSNFTQCRSMVRGHLGRGYARGKLPSVSSHYLGWFLWYRPLHR